MDRGSLDTDQQRRHQGCAACGTLRWFRRTDPPGRSTLPPAGSRCNPALMPHQQPAAATHGRRRQTCMGSVGRTWKEKREEFFWLTARIYTTVLFNTEIPQSGSLQWCSNNHRFVTLLKVLMWGGRQYTSEHFNPALNTQAMCVISCLEPLRTMPMSTSLLRICAFLDNDIDISSIWNLLLLSNTGKHWRGHFKIKGY